MGDEIKATTTKKLMTDEERLKLAEKLDRELDDYINSLEKKPRTTERRHEENWQEDLEKHPFFMKSPPKEGDELHPLYEGLQKLKYDPDENTPEELANSYKDDGNFNFKHKKYRLAILSYTEGIKVKCGNKDTEAALFNNRSAAHYFLGNYRSSLRDCEAALKLKPDYEKTLVRAANCCYEMKNYDKAVEYCDRILGKRPNDEVVISLKKKCLKEAKVKERDSRKVELQLKKREKVEEQLIEAIAKRGVKLEKGTKVEHLKPPFPQLEDYKVHLDDRNELVWPVVFLYPEYEIMDFVQGFNENERFMDHLSRMFEEPPEWDRERKYRLDHLIVYYKSEDERTLVTVKKTAKLGETISSKMFLIRNGTPSFFVLVLDSPVHRNFLGQFERVS